MARLCIRRKGGASVVFPLLSPITLVGRIDSAHVVLDDPGVSRVHAKIVREEREFVLLDLESRHGTKVNGSLVLRHRLADGDVIEIGSTRITYRQ